MTMKKLLVFGALGAVALATECTRTFVTEHYFISAFLAAGVFALVSTLLSYQEAERGGVGSLLNHDLLNMNKAQVDSAMNNYEGMFGTDSRKGGEEHAKLLEKRQGSYKEMVNTFYDLVTDFYEYGWGESFHFAPRLASESFMESLRRHEYYLAARLNLNSKTHCLDVGCGVGGPMRNIARFCGSKISGINNNDYQIKVGSKYNARDGVSDLCSMSKADFMHLNLPENHFDGAYQIEATCHAPDKVACFKNIFKVLKPGGQFAGYEWCVTDKYDAKNPTHRALKEGIEVGNSLPELATTHEVCEALKAAGFEVVDAFDKADGAMERANHIPWYDALSGKWTLQNFRMTSFGRTCTHFMITALETLRIAPKGSIKVSQLLNDTANDLVNSGKAGIFTPCFFFVARKPMRS